MLRRCEKSGVSRVQLGARCTDTDGTRLPERSFALGCDARVLREEGAP
jgi:hypothetical protein